MPMKPLKPCKHIGCNQLTRSTRCEEHTIHHKKETNKHIYNNRASYHHWYAKPSWKQLRTSMLIQHPLCASCLLTNTYTPSTIVDHIRPHKGDIHLFYDIDNLQTLCKRCHDRKTATDDGGFNNIIKSIM